MSDPTIMNSNNGVIEVFVAEVLPEKEQDYLTWVEKINLIEAKAPGFRGVHIQSPKENKGKFWITLLQFDTIENLDRWLESTQRQELLEESKSIISYFETHRVVSPFSGWFASFAKTGELPSEWKQTMLVLLVLFPLVMVKFKFLGPITANLNISLATFTGNALSVLLITFPMMPIAIYFLKWWLQPDPAHRKRITFAGVLVLIALYALEIWFFWDFV